MCHALVCKVWIHWFCSCQSSFPLVSAKFGTVLHESTCKVLMSPPLYLPQDFLQANLGDCPENKGWELKPVQPFQFHLLTSLAKDPDKQEMQHIPRHVGLLRLLANQTMGKQTNSDKPCKQCTTAPPGLEKKGPYKSSQSETLSLPLIQIMKIHKSPNQLKDLQIN